MLSGNGPMVCACACVCGTSKKWAAISMRYCTLCDALCKYIYEVQKTNTKLSVGHWSIITYTRTHRVRCRAAGLTPIHNMLHKLHVVKLSWVCSRSERANTHISIKSICGNFLLWAASVPWIQRPTRRPTDRPTERPSSVSIHHSLFPHTSEYYYYHYKLCWMSAYCAYDLLQAIRIEKGKKKLEQKRIKEK